MTNPTQELEAAALEVRDFRKQIKGSNPLGFAFYNVLDVTKRERIAWLAAKEVRNLDQPIVVVAKDDAVEIMALRLVSESDRDAPFRYHWSIKAHLDAFGPEDGNGWLVRDLEDGFFDTVKGTFHEAFAWAIKQTGPRV